LDRGEILDATESSLRRAGFSVSKRCSARPSCFDLTARKGRRLLLIKVSADLGGVSATAAWELRMISQHFSATPLIIGIRSRNRRLEDDTVYVRYSVYSITPRTFEDVILRGVHPLVEASPGGYYVRLNGRAIRERRHEIGLSIGKLAEMVGISRRTLYAYERGFTKASVSIAYKLEWILGIPVVQPINIFQSPSPPRTPASRPVRRMVRSRLLRAILEKLCQLNLRAIATRKAPFDFIAQAPNGPSNLIGGVSREDEDNIEERLEEIVSVCRVVRAQPIFITNGRKHIPNKGGVWLIPHKEFIRIKQPKDLYMHL